MILPKELQENFELKKVKEKSTEWILYLTEKKDKIPTKAQHRAGDCKIVHNGYMKSIELTASHLKNKPCYLRIKRRRWKIEGTRKGYHNTYKLPPKGLKCTYEFLDFLKGIGKRSRDKLLLAWTDLRHIRQKDFSLVSRIKRLCKRESSYQESLRN